jgi:hypothetical protein
MDIILLKDKIAHSEYVYTHHADIERRADIF